MTGHVRIHDVALVAGVSVSTVSNVLNRPGKVAEPTPSSVERAIVSMDFTPNAQAVSLPRRPAAAAGESQAVLELPNTTESGAEPPTPDECLDPHREVEEGRWQVLIAGQEVEFEAAGAGRGLGWVDSVMPDGSAVWIWLANGQCRVMLCPSDGIMLKLPDQSP